MVETVQYMSRMNALGLPIPKLALGSEIGSLGQKLRCYIHLHGPIDFEVTEVEKATCSDVNADRANVQHTYGQRSGAR